jgi:hypothetical protein
MHLPGELDYVNSPSRIAFDMLDGVTVLFEKRPVVRISCGKTGKDACSKMKNLALCPQPKQSSHLGQRDFSSENNVAANSSMI